MGMHEVRFELMLYPSKRRLWAKFSLLLRHTKIKVDCESIARACYFNPKERSSFPLEKNILCFTSRGVRKCLRLWKGTSYFGKNLKPVLGTCLKKCDPQEVHHRAFLSPCP